MDIDLEFIGWLEDCNIGPVQQSTIDQTTDVPYVWFNRRSAEQEVLLGGEKGHTTTYYDIECVATDIDTAQAMASKIKTDLHGFFGSMGSKYIHAGYVDDHSDEYEQVNGSDDGLFVANLDCSLIHT